MIITEAQIRDIAEKAHREYLEEKERHRREEWAEENRKCRELYELSQSLFKIKGS